MTEPDPSAPDHAAKRQGTDVECIDSRVLLQQRGCIKIRHRDQIYELRETRAGKLILTK
jgi:hemin uptake protein HemP